MSENRPFGFDPEDFDRKAREVGEGIRETLRGLGNLLGEAGVGTVWSSNVGPNGVTVTYPRRRTTGDTGDGVWAIFVVGDDGGATVEQVYATELDALRANKTNTDARRRVRFLPYGIAVSALDDDPDSDAGSGSDADVEPDPEH
ncbi:hypothetical protein GCM10023094_21200 [Rhodococcus olei]|uniref:Bacteriophage HK97-gp10 tail-component n=1 Tax=Rhodococcus olei TaxID=2161675 RepID=A0ABP8NYK8_9NOCA